MATTFPSRPEGPSRTWWSLSSKLPNVANGRPYSADKSSRQGLPKSSGLNFKAIASAIGLKKKHPSLAIQSPPPPPVQITTSADGWAKHPSRPPSKSVLSVRSQVDSPGSRKPLAGRRDTRQSLLTLSDVDPFASGEVSARYTSDPSRLSVHSNSSIAEVGSKYKGPSRLNRISYTSSSSHSNIHHGSELSPTSSNQSSTLTPDSAIQSLKPTFVLSFNLHNAYRDLNVGGQPEACIANGQSFLLTGHWSRLGTTCPKGIRLPFPSPALQPP
jgi:hypothetical protein